MGKISGYELLVIFDQQEKFTDKEAEELCEKIMDLLDAYDSVNIKLSPIVEDEE